MVRREIVRSPCETGLRAEPITERKHTGNEWTCRAAYANRSNKSAQYIAGKADMTQPTRNEGPSVSCARVESGSNGQGQQISHRKQLELTITVEKIDRFLEAIQQRITLLQQDATNLTEVKAQLGSREAHRRGI